MRQLVKLSAPDVFYGGNVGEKTPLKDNRDGFLRIGDVVSVVFRGTTVGFGIVCRADVKELKERRASGEKISDVNKAFYYISGYFDKCQRNGDMIKGFSVNLVKSYAIVQEGECYNGVHVIDSEVDSTISLKETILHESREFRG